MYHITIRFYEELNDFLKRDWRKRDFELSFKDRRSVKDLIESLGVPHVEVDLILVNGTSVDFSYIVQDHDRISVYPMFETLSIESATRLRPASLRDPRFILDVHLNKLARRMRLLGFDVDYHARRDDEQLAEISERENRILLSRDRQLMMRRKVSRGLYVRNTDPEKQVAEILDRLDLWELCRPFTRCVECNGTIESIDVEEPGAAEIRERIPAGVYSWCREYYWCASCGRIYWKGSHYDKLRRRVEGILSKRSIQA